MKIQLTTLPIPLALLCASCLQLPPLASSSAPCRHADCAESPPTAEAVEPEPEADPDPWARSADEPTVLYARDGSPVAQADAQAAMPVEPVPTAPNARDVQREDGRLYLLELYQNAVDERDELLDEVARQEAIILDLRSIQQSIEEQFAELQQRVQTLEQARLAAEEQSYELAGRLATAQIGRLQAELRELRREAGIPFLEAASSGGMAGAGSAPEGRE